MIIYLTRSILCLAILLLVYLLFLEKEKMHRFNRWYLLGSIVFACIVPLLSFTTTAESLAIPVLTDTYFNILEPANNLPIQQAIANESTNYQLPVLPAIYALVTTLLLIRFTANIYRLLSCAAKNKTINYKGARLVLLKEKTASHSFLNNIFISEEDYADRSIEEELITHELTHVREKHSWDVIFIELMQTIFWFNPLFIFYKKAIQLNHEYLADDAVIKTYENVPAYQYLLLDKASCKNNTYLTSNFNYSVTKKRLVMMTRTTNPARAILKKLTVLPILAGALFLFSSKEIAARQTPPPQQAESPQQKEPAKKPETLMHPFFKNTPFTKEGVPQASFDEYVAIQNKYKYFLEKGGHESIHFKQITDEDRNKLESVFKQMSREQQAKVQLIFFPPMKPIKANPPTEAQLNKWKDGNLYGVWIGDKKINNEELNNYQASDFAHYDASKLYPNARKNVKYLVQVNIMTHAQFNDMNDRIKKEKRFGMAYSNARAAEKSK